MSLFPQLNLLLAVILVCFVWKTFKMQNSRSLRSRTMVQLAQMTSESPKNLQEETNTVEAIPDDNLTSHHTIIAQPSTSKNCFSSHSDHQNDSEVSLQILDLITPEDIGIDTGKKILMGFLVKVVLVAALGVAAWFYFNGCCEQTIPKFDSEEWWGPKELKGKTDNTIRPFKVKFDEAMVQDLKYRLKNHRKFTPPLEGVGFEYGFNTAQIDGWLNYWADKYNFSEREVFLNKFPHFKTNIQGLDIHFIRIKPQVPKDVQTVPLLMIHGWPGSVREFYEAIPLLTRQTPGYNFVFELIIPSIPGYGFSDPAVRPGLGMPQTAVIFRNLMNRLGHQKFYVQGGDWGAGIVAVMSTLFPEDILGQHSNMLMSQHSCSMTRLFFGAFFPSLIVEDHLADRMYPLTSFFAYLMEEFGYMHIQATKPDTVGVPLTDSPAGLLAYILEKFATWTNRENKVKTDGGLGLRFSKDQLIDNLMIYWSTNSITTSMRFYAENFSNKIRDHKLDQITTSVPTWAIQAKYEIMYQPPSLLNRKYLNLINTTVLDDGGHFLAFELPQVFAADVFKAVKAFKEWHQKNKKTEL